MSLAPQVCLTLPPALLLLLDLAAAAGLPPPESRSGHHPLSSVGSPASSQHGIPLQSVTTPTATTAPTASSAECLPSPPPIASWWGKTSALAWLPDLLSRGKGKQGYAAIPDEVEMAARGSRGDPVCNGARQGRESEGSEKPGWGVGSSRTTTRVPRTTVERDDDDDENNAAFRRPALLQDGDTPVRGGLGVTSGTSGTPSWMASMLWGAGVIQVWTNS